MQENLKKKYEITDKALEDARNKLKLGKLCCETTVLIALADLLCNGDIAPEKSESDEVK